MPLGCAPTGLKYRSSVQPQSGLAADTSCKHGLYEEEQRGNVVPETSSLTTDLDDLLHEILGLAVWVCAVAGLMFLVHGQVLGLAVHGGRGAEHDLLDVELHHDLHEVRAPCHVVPVILQGQRARLPHSFEGGEVDDAVYGLAAVLRFGEHLEKWIGRINTNQDRLSICIKISTCLNESLQVMSAS